MKKEIEEIINNLEDISRSIEGKNILVTGGAGFLGSWLCEALAEQGANVICLDNLVSGLKANISHLMERDNFKFIQHDITQPIFFRNLGRSGDSEETWGTIPLYFHVRDIRRCHGDTYFGGIPR
jgi:hypothetical protein